MCPRAPPKRGSARNLAASRGDSPPSHRSVSAPAERGLPNSRFRVCPCASARSDINDHVGSKSPATVSLNCQHGLGVLFRFIFDLPRLCIKAPEVHSVGIKVFQPIIEFAYASPK